MLDRLRFSTLQSGLVLFWALWVTLIAMTNVFDALKTMGVLPEAWTLASYNYALVAQTVGAHGVPPAAAAVLFAGAVAWELLAAALLWRAYAALLAGKGGAAAEVTQAFVVSLALWAAFLIATEATVSYATAATHKGTLIAQLLTVILLRWDPAGPRAAALRP